MSKVWFVNVRREIEDPINLHIKQDTKPTEGEVFKKLAEEYYVNDDPAYCRVTIEEVELS